MLGIARSNLKSEHLEILILATVQSEISLNSEQLQNLLEFSGLFYYSIIKFLSQKSSIYNRKLFVFVSSLFLKRQRLISYHTVISLSTLFFKKFFYSTFHNAYTSDQVLSDLLCCFVTAKTIL